MCSVTYAPVGTFDQLSVAIIETRRKKGPSMQGYTEQFSECIRRKHNKFKIWKVSRNNYLTLWSLKVIHCILMLGQHLELPTLDWSHENITGAPTVIGWGRSTWCQTCQRCNKAYKERNLRWLFLQYCNFVFEIWLILRDGYTQQPIRCSEWKKINNKTRDHKSFGFWFDLIKKRILWCNTRVISLTVY